LHRPLWLHRLNRCQPGTFINSLTFCSISWHSDPGKEICRRFFIDPSVDFGFVDPIQVPDLLFDLFGIHNGFFSFQSPVSLENYPFGSIARNAAITFCSAAHITHIFERFDDCR
jgi:hypothetical protein